jgi:pyruvate dehydrogenase E2 component (dihydrolipoamide acetyltransferase)
MRQAIARRMAAAKREMPHYYVTAAVDMQEAMALRKQLNAAVDEHQRISVNDLIVKACALALETYPRFNASFTDQGLQSHNSIDIGIAVALDDGLIVPAVVDCRGKSLGALARAARDVAERARSGRLRQAEIAGGTFTISNLGMYGVETLIAIIQPGQAAILGVGKVEPRAVVRDGEVVARETMTIALSADHRVTDGAEGARFIAEVKALLENPVRLVL